MLVGCQLPRIDDHTEEFLKTEEEEEEGVTEAATSVEEV